MSDPMLRFGYGVSVSFACARMSALLAITLAMAASSAAAGRRGSARGTIRVQSVVSGAIVLLDGKEVGTTPLPNPVPAAPGSHLLVVQKNGYFEYRRKIIVRRGRSTSLIVDLLPTVESLEEVRAPTPADLALVPLVELPGTSLALEPPGVASQLEVGHPWYEKWWVWTLVGVAVAGGVTAAVVLTRPDAAQPVSEPFDDVWAIDLVNSAAMGLGRR